MNDRQELLELIEERDRRARYFKIEHMFPDEGEYRRELYPKHVEFMEKGATHRQRAFIAGNRVGKSFSGAYEMALHLTGRYPHWWKGRTFKQPIEAWAASKDNIMTRDVMQNALFGEIMDVGSGAVPKEDLGRIIFKSGVPGLIDTIYVRHHTDGKEDGWSKISFKSYEQGRAAFQGTKKQVVWLDEEPEDEEVYTECLTRTMDDKEPGMIYCTFTPLMSLSKVVQKFLVGGKFPEGGQHPHKPYIFVTRVEMDDVPHLSEEQKAEIISSYNKYEREARSKGFPSVGAGAIFPYVEDSVVVNRVDMEPWWPRMFAVNFTWEKCALVWVTQNPDTGVAYVYDSEIFSEEPVSVICTAIKARGKDMPGVICGARCARTKSDRFRVLKEFRLNDVMMVDVSDNLEGSIRELQSMFQAGTLKIKSNLRPLLTEYNMYRRDRKGQAVEEDIHAINALRYVATAGLNYAKPKVDPDDVIHRRRKYGRNNITGY